MSLFASQVLLSLLPLELAGAPQIGWGKNFEELIVLHGDAGARDDGELILSVSEPGRLSLLTY